MALTVTGYAAEARAAYRWLADTQLGDGSWFNYYLGDQVKDARLDTNVCAYLAAGLYHYLVATDDVDFCVELWPVVERAIDFVLPTRTLDGTIAWSLDSTGPARELRAVDGTSSIFHSLRCAVRWPSASTRPSRPGNWRPAGSATPWRITRRLRAEERVRHGLVLPVFSGALFGEAGLKRIDDGWERHVMDGYGVRCVSTSDSVTAAETAECVLALDALGEPPRGRSTSSVHPSTSPRGRRLLPGPASLIPARSRSPTARRPPTPPRPSSWPPTL